MLLITRNLYQPFTTFLWPSDLSCVAFFGHILLQMWLGTRRVPAREDQRRFLPEEARTVPK